MNKELFLEMLKEAFKDGSIKLDLSIDYDRWGKNLIAKVMINDEVVSEKSATIEVK